jgi:hypothetical protein
MINVCDWFFVDRRDTISQSILNNEDVVAWKFLLQKKRPPVGLEKSFFLSRPGGALS